MSICLCPVNGILLSSRARAGWLVPLGSWSKYFRHTCYWHHGQWHGGQLTRSQDANVTQLMLVHCKMLSRREREREKEEEKSGHWPVDSGSLFLCIQVTRERNSYSSLSRVYWFFRSHWVICCLAHVAFTLDQEKRTWFTVSGYKLVADSFDLPLAHLVFFLASLFLLDTIFLCSASLLSALRHFSMAPSDKVGQSTQTAQLPLE